MDRLEDRKGEIRFLELKIWKLESQPAPTGDDLREIAELRSRRKRLLAET
ncbi:MAG: hypothetical protein Q8O76_13255 [Chloroflexota bacterium]|nr:hypothetical protein [Chloroflexota bacterium]